jgi:hypothetical protein
MPISPTGDDSVNKEAESRPININLNEHPNSVAIYYFLLDMRTTKSGKWMTKNQFSMMDFANVL